MIPKEIGYYWARYVGIPQGLPEVVHVHGTTLYVERCGDTHLYEREAFTEWQGPLKIQVSVSTGR